jgi:hypothetical protein
LTNNVVTAASEIEELTACPTVIGHVQYERIGDEVADLTGLEELRGYLRISSEQVAEPKGLTIRSDTLRKIAEGLDAQLCRFQQSRRSPHKY